MDPESRRVSLGAQASRLPSLPCLPFLDDPWRSRGYLPHFDHPGLLQVITFRLADSLPQSFLDRCEAELATLPVEAHQTEREKRIAAWLDRGAGACHLRDPRVAELVENALLHFDGQRYRLIAWCIMPNHVHAMIETTPGHTLDQVLHSWKSFTAKQANRLLDLTGTFWQAEYHDRFIRDEEHFARAKQYIEHNPVQPGLVASADRWRWSSAWHERKAGGTPALPAETNNDS
ncbi:MAG: transposase [Acidobacteriota bacterium]